jgi:hypothetical protein
VKFSHFFTGISFSFDENDGEGQEEDDLHFCGRCRSTFADIAEFMVHKKRCKQPKVNKVDLRKAAVTLAVDLDADLTLATDEAAVISLLANQLSHQNNQQQRSNEAATEDALDHLTLVLNEELEAVQKASVVKLKVECVHLSINSINFDNFFDKFDKYDIFPKSNYYDDILVKFSKKNWSI